MPGPLPAIPASRTVFQRLARRPLENEGSQVIAVVGSPWHRRQKLVINAVEGIHGLDGLPAWGNIGTVWLTGSAETGVDAWIREWALENECTLTALWSEQEAEDHHYYDDQPLKRSSELVEQADIVVVMTWGKPIADEARIARLAIEMGRTLLLLVHDEKSADNINWPI